MNDTNSAVSEILNDDVTSENLEEKLDELIDVLVEQQEIEQEREEQKQEEIQSDIEQTEELKGLVETMSTNIESLNNAFGEGSELQLLEYQEISEIAQELSVQLEELSATVEKSSEFVEIGSNAIVTYAIFYIPLAVIVYCLWWFFKQFLTDFR